MFCNQLYDWEFTCRRDLNGDMLKPTSTGHRFIRFNLVVPDEAKWNMRFVSGACFPQSAAPQCAGHPPVITH